MYALIACGVFQKEIERIAKELDYPFQAHYLEPGLHVSFEALEVALKAKMEECQNYDGTIVAYGNCHPRMAEILTPYHAALLDCQNCIDAFITRNEMERLAGEGLYFYLSPGWVKCWRDIFARLGWGIEETRLNLGSFRGVIFLDTLGNAEDFQNALLEFFDYTLLQWTVMPVDLGHFYSLLEEAKERLEE
jgi:hypothetical protein